MPRIKQISVLHQGTIFGLHVSYGLSDGTVFERKHGEPIISVNNIVHDCICLTETESLCEVSGLASDGIIWQLGFVTLDEQTGVKRSCGPYGKGRPFGSWPNLLRFRTTGCVIAFGGICTPYMLTGLSCITAGTPPSMEVEDVDEGGPESS
ncbi:hypothetical protein BD410DRAFT_125938 [Rickenella mellea]|uniref:Jacalin-type lectin domain-containing protein n=1 Tax=Rickenella mellea TaxID=50990 RepID=A0A4Y7Q9W2_9AGAM|nr:hypothetical protein BD410DRAFT_125938 [Rickenella mellea]